MPIFRTAPSGTVQEQDAPQSPSPNGAEAGLFPLLGLLLVYTVWGAQPLYWRLFQSVPLSQILAHRIVWALPILFLFLLFRKTLDRLGECFSTPRSALLVLIRAVLIGSNWLLNIYAPLNTMVVEASLGQYITPIVVIILGLVVLKEELSLRLVLALILASIGVMAIALRLGRIPVISVLLVLTFASYTYLKKVSRHDPVAGTTAEMLVLAPFALAWILRAEAAGTGAVGNSGLSFLPMLASTGLFTALPLALFAWGISGVNLSRLGFIQYYAPSLNLFIGVVLFRENFTTFHFLGFSFIWLAILVALGAPWGKFLFCHRRN